MCLILVSCSNVIKPEHDLEPQSSQRRCLNGLPPLPEEDLIYGEDYYSLFGFLHNEGAEYVLQSLQDSDYFYFSDIDDSYIQTIKTNSLLYINQVLNSCYILNDLDMIPYYYTNYQLSSEIEHLIDNIRDILGSNLSISQMYAEIDGMRYDITSY